MKSYLVNVVLVNFVLFNLAETLSLSSSNHIIQFKPSSIRTEAITQTYPETFLNKLFSSVPRREKAIDNISLSFGHFDSINEKKPLSETCGSGLSLLVGRSASGKSTLLRILAQMEEPKSGQMVLNGSSCFMHNQQKGENSHGIEMSMNEASVAPKPIIIDAKPDCFDTKSSLFQRILECIPEFSIDFQKQEVNQQQLESLKENVVCEYAQILGFTLDQIHSYTPSDLTPSQQYLFGLVCSSVESSFAANLKLNEDNVLEIPRPILLLDELLDKETSGVANKVGDRLLNLTEKGGIVIAATHRPQFLTGVAERVVTLSSGKVLKVEYLDNLGA